jgi:hypothetical protein
MITSVSSAIFTCTTSQYSAQDLGSPDLPAPNLDGITVDLFQPIVSPP